MLEEEEFAPLLIAAAKNNLETVQKLLSEGTDANSTGQNDLTSLHAVAHCTDNDSHYEVVKLLLENKAKVDACNEDGYTPLQLLVHSNKRNDKIFKLFLDSGADVNTSDLYGTSSLHAAARNNNVDLTDKLLANKADVDIRNTRNRTPLHFVAYRSEYDSHLEVVKKLLEYKANVHARDIVGETPLYSLALGKTTNEKILKLLIDSGADVDSKDKEGMTALYAAIYRNNVTLIGILLSLGAKVNVEEAHKRTPLHYAVNISKGDSHLEVVRMLLENGADPNPLTNLGYSCLHILSTSTDFKSKILQLLLDNGADVNLINEEGFSPLHAAVKVNNLSVAEKLVSRGANVNVRDKGGLTPLHYATYLSKDDSHLKVVELLLKSGAEVDARDEDGDTPFKLLLKNKNVNAKIFRLLRPE